MMGFDLSNFDRTNLLMIAFSLIGLIRQRSLLPFVIALLGAILQGPLVPVLLCGLMVWHRMDRQCSKWIQIKDLAGLFLIVGAAVSSDSLKAFFQFFGFFLITTNLGGSALGVMPATLLLRQYSASPEFLELSLGAIAVYWITAEAARGFKWKLEREALAYLEVGVSAVLLMNLKPEFESWTSDPAFLGLGVTLGFFTLAMTIGLKFKKEGVYSFVNQTRIRLQTILLFGSRWVSGEEPWSQAREKSPTLDFEAGLTRSFWVVLATAIGVMIMILMSKGGAR